MAINRPSRSLLALLLILAGLFEGGSRYAEGAFLSQHMLDGTWRATLMLDSATLPQGRPSGDTVRGWIRIGPAFRTFSMHRTIDTVGALFGTHDLDFTPFWGGPIPPEYSTSVLSAGETSPITEVFARVYSSDNVVLTLNPRFSHGAVKLMGALVADSLVSGTWVLQSHRSRAAGHFSMTRDVSQ